MARTVAEAVDLLDELADLEELKGDQFRSRAYRRAARAVGTLEGSLEEVLASGKVEELPGVGEGILKKLKELAGTGKVKKLEQLRAELPKGLVEMMRVPGLGPKRAMVLFQELRIDGLAKLKEACEQGRLLEVKGFGEKRQQDILRGIAMVEKAVARMLLPQAQRIAAEVEQALKPHAAKLAAAGSLRRRRDTVGDLDFVAVARKGHDPGRALLALPGAEPLAQGEAKVSVRLASGVQVDLRLMAPEEFGAALQYFTGSKAHNIKLRGLAIRRGWRLNEYGLFQEKEDGSQGRRLAGGDEEGIYAKLGLPPVPPELREDTGEVEAAMEGKLPELVEERHLQGDLHTHSKRSDGALEPAAWLKAVAQSGFAYVGLTDHGIGLPGWGLSGPDLVEHRGKVLELAEAHAGKVRVLVGVEANILKDGELDIAAKHLDELDYVIAGVHTHFGMDRGAMTRRIVKALRDGRVHVLAHPTGRILGEREPLDFDREKVWEAAAASRTALEMNAQPDRLDLNGEAARRAKELGCRFVVSSDCHQVPKRELLRWGLEQARRGWLEAADVLNTLPAGEFLKALRGR